MAANRAAAKAFPDRDGGGYLGRSLSGASGSVLIAGTASMQRLNNGRCHCVKRWRVRSSLKSSAQASSPIMAPVIT
jgi:hypothetical protein